MSNTIEKLEVSLTEAQDAYYTGIPIMTDAEYDALADGLRTLDPTNAVLQRVGSTLKDSRLQKVQHSIPMNSLNKVNSEKEFRTWVKGTNSEKFVLQEKLDGLSVELVYKNGKFKDAISRGTGEIGESIGHTVSHMKNVFDKLPGFTGSLRGEIIFTKSAFKGCFGDDSKKHGYSNPRNAAAGLARSKTVDPVTDKISVIYYDCDADNTNFEKEHHKIRFMENDLKVKCVTTKVVGLENAIEWYRFYEDARKGLDHEIDGLVFKVNSIEIQNKLGSTNQRPAGQIALKFSNEMRKTILKDVTWQVGLTGRITPVAVFQKVHIDGVDIVNASLHNVSNMANLGVYPGAEVLVSRRNQVIPFLERVIKPAKTNEFGYPKACPICSARTQFEGEFLVCPNADCPAKKSGDIAKWVRVLEIDNVGDSFIAAALKSKIIEDPADLYVLSEDTIALLDRQGPASAKKIIRNINKAKELPLPKFLAALNISNASVSTFEALAKGGFDSIDSIQQATWKDFTGVPGIGEITAKAVCTGVQNKAKLISKLLKNGVCIKKKIIGKLTGESFCFTGEISIKRPDAMKFVEALGGEVKSSVSMGLTYLVQSNPNSSSTKAQKARQYGTKVIGEKEFFDLVDFSFKKLKELNQ